MAVVARAPRPPGSAAHREVRDWLADTLEKAGYTVEIQLAATARLGLVVENVIGVLPGRRSDALLFVAHYDSVKAGPGASDDGGGVAAVLAAARALAGKPHENTVVILLTDGEESGLLGAYAFREHPRDADVMAVINFEARGSGGPSVMFQAGPESGALLDVFADSPAPIASSLAAAVYAVLPNDTDFTVLAADRPGLNFAWFDRMIDYHAPTDDLAHLDRHSLQHHAASALALTALADADLSRREPSGVYLPSPFGLIRYSSTMARVLALTTLLALGLASRRPPVFRGLGAGLALIVAGLLAALVTLGVGHLVGSLGYPPDDSPQRWPLRVVFLATGLGCSLLFAGRVRRPEAPWGAALVAALVGVPWALYAPESSYLVALPTLALALGSLHPKGTVLLAPLALVAVLPFTALLFAALPLAWAPYAMVPTVFLAALLAPSLRLPGWVGAVMVGAGLAGLVALRRGIFES